MTENFEMGTSSGDKAFPHSLCSLFIVDLCVLSFEFCLRHLGFLEYANRNDSVMISVSVWAALEPRFCILDFDETAP